MVLHIATSSQLPPTVPIVQLFSPFSCGADVRHEFGLQLQLLLDTLALFTTASSPMTAHYPGPQGELVCEYVQGPTSCGKGNVL